MDNTLLVTLYILFTSKNSTNTNIFSFISFNEKMIPIILILTLYQCLSSNSLSCHWCSHKNSSEAARLRIHDRVQSTPDYCKMKRVCEGLFFGVFKDVNLFNIYRKLVRPNSRRRKREFWLCRSNPTAIYLGGQRHLVTLYS